MITISLYNMKGGVGKTAAAVNLSWLAVQENKRVLLCDLDPQGSATYYFRIKPKIADGLKSFLKGNKKLERSIKATDYKNLDLLPSDFSFRKMDIRLDRLKRSKKRLKKTLGRFASDYDILFIDCPPNINLVSENIFFASDLILVPVIPTTLSARTFKKLFDFFKKEKLPEQKLVPFFSMVETRKTLHTDSISQLRKEYPSFMKTVISYSSYVEKMGIHRAPLGCFNPHSRPAVQYQALWTEVKKQFNV